jgi:hypothetical protein
MDEVIAAELADVMGHVGSLAAAGMLDAAAEAFLDRSHLIYTEEELDAGVAADFWKVSACSSTRRNSWPSPQHPARRIRRC